MSFQLPDTSGIDINKIGRSGGGSGGSGGSGGRREPKFIDMPGTSPHKADFYRMLTSNTGTGWCLGLVGGTVTGTFRAFRLNPGGGLRILLNSVLNHVGRDSTGLANRVGVAGPSFLPLSLPLFAYSLVTSL